MKSEKKEMKWVAEIKKQLLPVTLDLFLEEDKWLRQCIYRVPPRIKEINPKAYEPQMVSIGPYHHGKPDLMPMELHKRRALLRFLERTKKPIEELGAALEGVVYDLMGAYEHLEEKWQDKDRFLQLMLVDGCFLLEITSELPEDFRPSDPIFSVHGVLNSFNYIVPDILMVENQLPLLVLARLMALEKQISFEEAEVTIHTSAVKFFFPPGTKFPMLGFGLHLLDLFRRAIVQDPLPPTLFIPKAGTGVTVRSAVELHDAGVIFQWSNTYSLRDVTFQNGVLRIPIFVIEQSTKSIFSNIIALERLRPEAGHDVRTYVFFLFGLVNSVEDVVLLKSLGLIQSLLGSDEAVVELLNSLSRDIFFDPSSRLSGVRDSLNEYYMKYMNKWNKRLRDWHRNLKRNYFDNPWALISVITATFVLALAFTQTYYSALSYYKGASN